MDLFACKRLDLFPSKRLDLFACKGLKFRAITHFGHLSDLRHAKGAPTPFSCKISWKIPERVCVCMRKREKGRERDTEKMRGKRRECSRERNRRESKRGERPGQRENWSHGRP